MYAIILAGGFGTRLRSVVSDVPKPLAPIGERPFLAWLADALIAQGIDGITLSVHHQWEKIRDYFDQHPLTVPLSYAIEEKPLGTGGAIAYALACSGHGEPVLALNGDTFVSVDYQALYRQHCNMGMAMTMVLRRINNTGRYGEAIVQNGVVSGFRAGQAGHSGLINAGVYVLSPTVFEAYPLPEVFSFEQDFLQAHVGTISPGAFIADDYFIDIGIPEDYIRACDELPRIIAERAHAIRV